ncbi:MAG: hypothetical protein IT382_09555 [Deltaproteobacteria bacterium]|nr:hypothetical protein [Deltaproteobacteria bacterium]
MKTCNRDPHVHTQPTTNNNHNPRFLEERRQILDTPAIDALRINARDGFERNIMQCPPPARFPSGNGQGVGGPLGLTPVSELETAARLAAALSQLKSDYKEWRTQNPSAVEPGDGCRCLGEILDDPTLSSQDLCVHIIAVIVHERPEAVDELRATIPAHELPENEPVQAAPAPSGEGSNTEISRGLFSAFGMGANLLGGLLSSPLAVPVLTAVCAAIPGAQVLLPFLPIIAPVAGMALSGLGGMATQVGQGQAPDLDPSSLLNPEMLTQLGSAVTGGVGGAAGLPIPLPIPGI